MDLNNVPYLDRYYDTNPERIPIVVLFSTLKMLFYDSDSTISTTYVPASGKTLSCRLSNFRIFLTDSHS